MSTEKEVAYKPDWLEEKNWMTWTDCLPTDDDEVRESFAAAWGTLFAYAALTQTRMLALRKEPYAEYEPYAILFSFSSDENKAEFLRLIQSNDSLAFDDDEIDETIKTVPDPAEIAAARPVAMVFPNDLIRNVTELAVVILSAYGRVDLKVVRHNLPLCSKCCTFAEFKG
jgi:hypothetical protein